MLHPGDKAPAFELWDDQGNLVHLQWELKKGSLLLYFYPADFTPGCTKEARMFRNHFRSIQEKGIQIFGISPQKKETHAGFRKSLNLPFPLLSDPHKKAIKAYGANGPFGLGVRRMTFFIGQEGIIKEVLKADFLISKHEDLVQKILARLEN